MTSLCMSVAQSNYQQYQLTNGNIMLLAAQQQQQQQQQQHQHQHQQQSLQQLQYNNQQAQQLRQQQHIVTKVLGTSQLQNIQAATGLGPMLLPKKQKFNYASMPTYGEQLPSVARRNARERNRVKQVNNGFVNLRQHLPQTVINTLSNGGRGASKKLSKVDTLRIAVEYIRGLQDLLDDAQPQHLRKQQHHQHQQQQQQRKQHRHNFHSDDSSNDDSCAYSSMGSPHSTASAAASPTSGSASPQQFSQMHHTYHSEQSISPTPSYSASDASHYIQQIKLEAQEQQQQQHHQQQQQQQHTKETQFKFEPFDSFSDDQPDDEELLDYISSWQEQ